MTSAMLRRSRGFARFSGTPVEVLTFDARDDYPQIEADLRSDGRLSPELTVRNLWDDLTRMAAPASAAGANRSALDGFDPLPPGGRTSVRLSARGAVLQVDRRRDDGTLAVSDRRDVNDPGKPGGRSIVLCDAEGEPVLGFPRANALYSWWLDTVIDGEESFLLVDSKTAAGVVAGYRSPSATRVHILHNSHLAGESRPWGRVRSSRRQTLTRLEDFDAVVVLSERQRADIELLLGRTSGLEVVPNAAPLPDSPPTSPRDPALGVVLASLDDRKRIGDAVRAIAAARAAGSPVRLDVYGDGPRRGELESLATELGVAEHVRFRGYQPDAVESFGTASFLLLTSRAEGFPLVLAEGMSRGCIPISYDIPYGPADIIDDGRSGFLVPPGDIAALAARIADVASGGAERMRPDAVAAAARFSDEAVTARWGEVLTRAKERHDRPAPDFRVEVKRTRVRRSRSSLAATVDFSLRGVHVPPADVTPAVALHGPRSIELRATGSVRRTLRHGTWRAEIRFPAEAASWLPEDVALEAEFELRIGGAVRRTPLGGGNS